MMPAAMACFRKFTALTCLLLPAAGWTLAPAQPGGKRPMTKQEAPSEQEAAEPMFSRIVPVRPGVDRCVVCLKLLAVGDKVYLVEGQRVGVKGMMEDQLFADPWRYIAVLKPRGGLFGGEMAPGSGISDAWLVLGMYVLLGLAFSAVCAHRALNTGQAPVLWFLVGFFFNAFGYLALLLRSVDQKAAAPAKYSGVVKIPSTAEPQSCPDCNALNHPSAAECSRCGSLLAPASVSEVTRAGAGSK